MSVSLSRSWTTSSEARADDGGAASEGKVIIPDVHLSSRSYGANRISGGSLQIN